MKKKVKHIIFIVILSLAAIFVVEHAILVKVAKTALRYVVSLNTDMSKVTLDPGTGSIIIRGVKIYNPSDFKERVLADIPLITMDFKFKTLLEKGVFFDNIVVNIKEINVIKNAENKTNIAGMRVFQPKGEQKESGPFFADRYAVEIDKAKYIDYTQGEKPVVKEIDLNIKEEYKNVRNPNNVLRAIGFKLYFSGKLQDLGINIQNIQKELKRLAEENKKLKEEFARIAGEKIETAKEVVKEKIGAAKEVIKDTAQDVQVKAGEVKEAIKDTANDVKTKAGEVKEAIVNKIETIQNNE